MRQQTREELADFWAMIRIIAVWCAAGIAGWLIFWCLLQGACWLADVIVEML